MWVKWIVDVYNESIKESLITCIMYFEKLRCGLRFRLINFHPIVLFLENFVIVIKHKFGKNVVYVLFVAWKVTCEPIFSFVQLLAVSFVNYTSGVLVCNVNVT